MATDNNLAAVGKVLITLERVLHDKKEADLIRAAAAEGLGALGGILAWNALLPFAEDHNEAPTVRTAALKALGNAVNNAG